MRSKLVPRWLLLALICAAIVLPVALCVVAAVAALLIATGDSLAGGVLGWIGVALGIFWVVDLVVLIVAQGVMALDDRDEPPEE